MIGYPHFLVAAIKTVANAAVYLISGRRKLILEGKVRSGIYQNWSGDRRHRANLFTPKTEQEVAAIIRNATNVRVVGSGHSFNDSLATTGTTISLDELAGVVQVDTESKQATVLAGTRLRDLNPALAKRGLAIRSLASHDAQSVAGILSTDVHGTGKLPAHLSDQVVSMRLVDGTGEIHDLEPSDDLFRAAVGGIGSVGVITSVTVQCVDAFRLQQRSFVETRSWAEENLDRLLADHDHVSFYVYPFTEMLHVHTWDHTTEPRARFGRRREAANEAKAAVTAATVGDAMAHLGALPKTATAAMKLQQGTSLVLDSYEAFSRSQYHLHQELELAVPRHRVWEDLDRSLAIYEELYRERKLPFLLVEVRFSPAGHDRSLLGPGGERETAWLCLCANQSGAVGEYFDAIERWLPSTDARVHLGKWCESLDKVDTARMYGDDFHQFQAVRHKADPDGRFGNPFTDRVFGPSPEN